MDWIWILIPLTALMIPIVAIWTTHQRHMIEMRLKLGAGASADVASQLQDIRKQIAEMRDTTTRYDMSFDSALQRMESRVGSLEGKVQTIEQGTNAARR